MAWVLWILAGLALLGLEMLTPGGFVLLFFGVAAVLVGALVGLGLGGPPWLEWLLFSVLALGSMLLLRGPLRARLNARLDEAVGTENLVGEIATLMDDVEPGAVGKAELRGTAWTVRSAETARLARGQRCRVDRVEGLTLWVRAD